MIRLNRFNRQIQAPGPSKISQENLKKLYEGPGFESFLQKAAADREAESEENAEPGVRIPSHLCGIPLPQEAMTPEKYKRDKKSKDIFRLPPWLKVDIPKGKDYHRIKNQMKELKLATVCEEAKCPNIGECWNTQGDKMATMTVMVLGEFCTRGCRFCSVRTMKRPPKPDPNEPEHVAQAIADWNSGYIVITAVDRDDLEDGGASHFADTVRAIKNKNPNIMVETLVGDFQGNKKDIETVIDSGMEVFAHNIETVNELHWLVRDPRAKYQQTLDVLKYAKEYKPDIITKTSIMLGFGETDEQVYKTLEDLRAVGVDCVTLGQYMQPTKRHLKVAEYWVGEGKRPKTWEKSKFLWPFSVSKPVFM